MQQPAPLMQRAPPRNDSEAQLAVIAMLSAASRMLAVRLILLLALIGGFVLAIMAVPSTNLQSLWVLIAYGMLVMLPIVWLEHGNRGG